jgi:hypothetical protein
VQVATLYLWIKAVSSHVVRTAECSYFLAWFSPSKADTSLFTFQHDGVQIFMLVYVDDIVIAGSTPVVAERLVQSLFETFSIKDLDQLEYFLELEVSSNSGGMTRI